MVIGTAVILASVVLLCTPVLSDADGCPNEPLRMEEGYAPALPDCRAYEQVSSTDKNLADAEGKGDYVQSSPTGERVTFFSFTPFPEVPGTAEEFPTYLSTRESNTWATQGLIPRSEPGTVAALAGLTEDLTGALVYSNAPQLIEVGAIAGQYSYYMRNNLTSSYQLFARDPSGLPFYYVDATPSGSRILFESQAALTGNAVAGVQNLYEWDNGAIRLVGLLPEETTTPIEGAVAGAGGPTIAEEERGEFGAELPGGAASSNQLYTENTLSEDGARVFFTDVATGRIYMRELESETTVAVSEGPAYWRAATPDGRYVFYTEGEGSERKLYRYDADDHKSEVLTGSATEPWVLGTLGVSDDGTYVYFVARAALSEIESKTDKLPEAGNGNLYEWHEGHRTAFIADLGNTGGQIEENESDWTGMANTVPGPAQGGKSSRVTPEGTRVLFSSTFELTGYQNEGHTELFLYNGTVGQIICVSCASKAPAVTGAQLVDHSSLAPGPRNAFLSRNLSANGKRVFFQTAESLVPQDTNGKLDVYEWEEGGKAVAQMCMPLAALT